MYIRLSFRAYVKEEQKDIQKHVKTQPNCTFNTTISTKHIWAFFFFYLTENRLYFVDGGLHKIEVMDLQGGNRRVILQDSSSHFFSLDIFGRYIYYTDWNEK